LQGIESQKSLRTTALDALLKIMHYQEDNLEKIALTSTNA